MTPWDIITTQSLAPMRRPSSVASAPRPRCHRTTAPASAPPGQTSSAASAATCAPG